MLLFVLGLRFFTQCRSVNFKHCMAFRGQWISFHPLPNEDGGLRLWYRDWSSRRTCNFPIFRQWQPAKPRTGMSFFNMFQHVSTFFNIFNIFQHFSTCFNVFNPPFNLMSVRFLQSVREVNLLPTRAMEKFRFDPYSSLLSNSTLSGLTGTVDATVQIKPTWANGCTG